MDPDNPVKALYIEFMKGYYSSTEPFDLTLDQLLLIFADMILQHKFHARIHLPFPFRKVFKTGNSMPEKNYKERSIAINEAINSIVERCKELRKRSGGNFR